MDVAENGERDSSELPSSSSFFSVIGLGIAVSLGLFSVTFRKLPPKPLSVAINVANSALTGTKALHLLNSPSSPESLLFASKTLVKTYKFSRRLNIIQPKTPSYTTLSTFVKTLKPYLGAVSLVKYVNRSSFHDGGVLGFGILSYGYKFSKNFVKVLEGFVGIELDAAVKSGFDSVGLVVKAVKVARELEHIRGGWEQRNCCFYRGCGGHDDFTSRHALRLGFKRFDVGGGIERVNAGWFLPCCSCDFVADERLDACVSELMCLSIPIKD